MKNKFGKFMVLGLFLMIFLVACNATEAGRIEAYYIGDGGFIVSKKSENFVPGDLIMATNKTDHSGLSFGQNYSILVADELYSTTPPSFSIKSISEDLGKFEYLNMSFVRAGSILGLYGSESITVDLRPKEDYDQGHVPDAINLSLDDIQAGEDFSDLLRKDQLIFVYGKGQAMSRDGAKALVSQGYKLVFDLGDIKAYAHKLEQ
ncbi:MAG: rhodanese-like domain-containing protein [Bacillota bacterium]|nr:rhodanese-like domain-containing protein [Bacillota bacterium]